VLRLIRVGIGDLQLGQLPKGGWRVVTESEIESLLPTARAAAGHGKTR
jgi:23S rRNA pseudouridine2605 synthase